MRHNAKYLKYNIKQKLKMKNKKKTDSRIDEFEKI